MKNTKKISRVWLALVIFSALSLAAGTPLLAFLALTGKYIPMAIMMPVVGHGYLGLGFYVRALYRARLYGKLAELSKTLDTFDPEVLGGKVGLIPSATEGAIKRAREKGYL